MTASSVPPRLPVTAAMLCGGVLSAQFVGSKAARDAIYLEHLDVTTLPQIVIATSLCSIALVALSSKSLRRCAPSTFVPLTFIVSALLFVIEWALVDAQPLSAARILYVHVSGLGPMLGSGFWLIASEIFDPHSAKRRFSQIAGAATVGGLVGGVLADRTAALAGVHAILLGLAVINVVCAWQIWRLSQSSAQPHAHDVEVPADLAGAPTRQGLRALAATPYLRDLAALVLLGTIGAAVIDYLFKAQAVAAFGRGDDLLRFFSIFYAATSLVTFVAQMTASRLVLERAGLAAATATPSAALLLGAAGALIFPGLSSTIIARGGESVFRGSLFRAGYEVFYTPVAQAQKRAAKSIIDVGFDRLGDAAGAVIVALSQSIGSEQLPFLLLVSIGCSALVMVVAGRLRRGYVHTLERSLRDRALELDLTDIEDVTTRTAMFKALGIAAPGRPAMPGDAKAASRAASTNVAATDPQIHRIVELRSRDRDRVVAALHDEDGVAGVLVPHIVSLLAWDAVADEAVHALRKVAEERVGELTDALIDPNQPFAVRRRLARVFSICVSQRAVDGLMLGLEDLRFEVRFQCGRSLAAILERNPRVRVDEHRAFDAVLREVAVSHPVWAGRQLLDRPDETAVRSSVGDLVLQRANQSLSHVFTLLALVLPTEPLQIALRALHTDDARLRGTALEYLECVLPPNIRDRLWPFLEAAPPAATTTRSREEVLADLLRSRDSIILNLEELQGRSPQESR